MTTDEKPSGWPDGRMRPLVITWPRTTATKVDGTPTGRAPHPTEVTLTDWDTSEPIVSATRMDLIVDCATNEIVAELTMLVGEDGLPLPHGAPLPPPDEDGNFRTGVFRWAVAEIRVAE